MLLSLLLGIVYEPLLQPDDTFRIRRRKVVLAGCFVSSFVLLAIAIWYLVHGSSPDVGWSRAVAHALVPFVFCFSYMGSWAVCRYTKQAGDILMKIKSFFDIFVAGSIVAFSISRGFSYDPYFLVSIFAITFIAHYPAGSMDPVLSQQTETQRGQLERFPPSEHTTWHTINMNELEGLPPSKHSKTTQRPRLATWQTKSNKYGRSKVSDFYLTDWEKVKGEVKKKQV